MRDRLMLSAASQQGLARAHNEDSFAVLEKDGLYPAALVVADGMGGHNRGELASQLAIDYVSTCLETELARLTERSVRSARSENALLKRLTDIAEKANIKVYLGSRSDSANIGMGTTLTFVVLVPGKAFFAHIGDSRAYLMRRGRLCQMTVDHTLVQELIAAGQITVEEALNHPRRNVVTRSLGVPEYMQPDVGCYPWERGDRLLLCSDGLSGFLRDEEIAALLRTAANPEQAVQDLIRAALATNGGDDITVAVAFA